MVYQLERGWHLSPLVCGKDVEKFGYAVRDFTPNIIAWTCSEGTELKITVFVCLKTKLISQQPPSLIRRGPIDVRSFLIVF